MRIEKNKVIYLGIVALATYVVIYYWDTLINGIGTLFKASSPLILGCVIAYILNIVMSFFEERVLDKCKNKIVIRLKRGISILMSIATIVIVFFLIARLIIPEFKSCIELLVAGIAAMIEDVSMFLKNNPDIAGFLPENISNLDVSMINWQGLINGVFDWFRVGASTILVYVSSFFSTAFNIFVALIFALYILSGKERLKEQITRIINSYLHKNIGNKIFYIGKIVDNSFHSFMVGQCIEAIILGTLCISGMLILRLPYAMTVGVVIGVTALIPIAGAYVGAVVGAIMVFTVSPVKATIFIVFILILQQLENQLIYPKVVGDSIGLPGIWVFAAVIVGGGLFGIMGVILGIPVVSVFYQLLRNDLTKRESIK